MTESLFANPADVEAAAKDWTDGQVLCRRYGHPWQPSTAVYNPVYRYYTQTHRCLRCRSADPDATHEFTEKHEELNEHFHPYATWMIYADGYLTEGIGRIAGEGKDVIRGELIRRQPVTKLTAKQARDARPRSSYTREAVNYRETNGARRG